MNYADLKEYLRSSKPDDLLKRLYCTDDIGEQKNRYLNLLDKTYELYGDGEYHFVSSPGRSEIGGNHTDHQHGHVVAAGLNIDNLVCFKPNNSNIINYKYKADSSESINLSDLSINEEEKNTTASLFRGLAAKFKEEGYEVGGFDALCDSRVLVGSGISSSACFEVMVAEIFNCLFNDDKVSAVDRAKFSQYAENVYFGKPSGLLDQMAISVGGFVTIDFKDTEKPVIENYDFSFADYGYEFILVNTKGDHSDLSHEYAAVTQEMKMVSKCLGVEYLADSSLDNLMNNFSKIREEVNNDRAILRAIHFFNEDERAVKQKEVIKNKDIKSLLKLMNESGRSSFEYLQNVYPASRPSSQSLAVGLALADMILKDDGAYRVHGGGFEGTIQAIVPENKSEEFKKVMKNTFGDDCLLEVKVRPVGTVSVI